LADGEETVSEETLRKHLEKAIEFQRLCMEDGDEQPLYHAILAHPNDQISMYALDASMFGPWETKNKVMAVLVKDLFDQHGVCLALVTEGFEGRCPPHVDPGTLPDDLSQWPEEHRETVLLCAANAPGEQGVCCHQVFHRQPGNVTYEPIVWWGPDHGYLRFCYDFRGVTCWQDAVQLVMMRGREGVVAKQ
jgi:hypothetical protein